MALLARTLRAATPGLSLVQVRWVERSLIEEGRLRLDPPVLLWWRIDHALPVDPREVLRTGSRLSPSLAVFDFDRPHELPALGWLGPLKLEVLRCLTDVLLDHPPVPQAEEIHALLQDLAVHLLSPVDLLDAAEAMLASAMVRGSAKEARSEALARIIGARFSLTEGDGEVPVRAVVALGRGQPIESRMREVLAKAGLMEGHERLPPAELLGEVPVLRAVVTELASNYPLPRPLTELAPGVFPIEEAPLPAHQGPIAPAHTAELHDLEKVHSRLMEGVEFIERGYGHLKEAEAVCLEVAAAYQSLQEIEWEARAWQVLTLVYMLSQRFKEAENVGLRALSLHHTAGNTLGETQGKQNLGRIYTLTGRLNEAEETCQQALASYRQLGDHDGEAETLCLLGWVALKRGELVKAAHFAKIALLHPRGSRPSRADTWDLLAQISLAAGKPGHAAVLANRAALLSLQERNPIGAMNSFGRLSAAMAVLVQPQAATAALRLAWSQATSIQAPEAEELASQLRQSLPDFDPSSPLSPERIKELLSFVDLVVNAIAAQLVTAGKDPYQPFEDHYIDT
ncbi:MAG TPA: tetratricopeptide repeat protein [Polyangia bacterium]|nr:tetratricopeptide repeat protein [Polyangia bacterium]